MRVPFAARFWDVDACIECLPLGEHDKEVTSALLEAMPTAYGARPFRETPPEPDADPEFKLDVIWDKLSERVQFFLLAAFAREGLL